MCRFAAHNIVSSESGTVSQLKKKINNFELWHYSCTKLMKTFSKNNDILQFLSQLEWNNIF